MRFFFNIQIDVSQFITVLEAFKPDIAECLCDTIPAAEQTDKRIRKSVDRTLKFLDKCIEEKGIKVGTYGKRPPHWLSEMMIVYC